MTVSTLGSGQSNRGSVEAAESTWRQRERIRTETTTTAVGHASQAVTTALYIHKAPTRTIPTWRQRGMTNRRQRPQPEDTQPGDRTSTFSDGLLLRQGRQGSLQTIVRPLFRPDIVKEGQSMRSMNSCHIPVIAAINNTETFCSILVIASPKPA